MRSRTFRLLLVVAGVLLLVAAVAPSANATSLTYFNFNDTTSGGAPDFTSFDDLPGLQPSVITSNYNPAGVDAVEGLELRIAPGHTEIPNLQNSIDNIQLDGIGIPEPATIWAGLLGVLGLCWHQRRQLIRSLRSRRA